MKIVEGGQRSVAQGDWGVALWGFERVSGCWLSHLSWLANPRIFPSAIREKFLLVLLLALACVECDPAWWDLLVSQSGLCRWLSSMWLWVPWKLNSPGELCSLLWDNWSPHNGYHHPYMCPYLQQLYRQSSWLRSALTSDPPGTADLASPSSKWAWPQLVFVMYPTSEINDGLECFCASSISFPCVSRLKSAR